MNYLFYKKKFPTFCKMYFSWIKNYEQIEYYNNSITHVFPIELNEDFFKKSLKDFIDEYICGIGSGFIYVGYLKNELFIEILENHYIKYKHDDYHEYAKLYKLDFNDEKMLNDFLIVVEIMLNKINHE